MKETTLLNPTLAGHLEAARRGQVSLDRVRQAIEDWPAYQPGELAQKAAALDALAAIEVERLEAALRSRRGEAPP